MKKNVSVITADKYLFQKILLELSDEYNVMPEKTKGVALVLVDIDTVDVRDDGAITMSRYGKCDIPLPFPIGSLSEHLKSENEKTFYLDNQTHSAFLRGEKIKLTDVEFSLLSLIYGAGGEFVSREEILEKVWKNSADSGVINVYVHYLREKLERHGEKIIISSRNGGYKLDEKYLGGAVC